MHVFCAFTKFASVYIELSELFCWSAWKETHDVELQELLQSGKGGNGQATESAQTRVESREKEHNVYCVVFGKLFLYVLLSLKEQ